MEHERCLTAAPGEVIPARRWRQVGGGAGVLRDGKLAAGRFTAEFVSATGAGRAGCGRQSWPTLHGRSLGARSENPRWWTSAFNGHRHIYTIECPERN